MENGFLFTALVRNITLKQCIQNYENEANEMQQNCTVKHYKINEIFTVQTMYNTVIKNDHDNYIVEKLFSF